MVFGSEFGCPGLQKQAFGIEGIAKINFRRNSISYDSRVEFSWFWVALGAIFMAFVALETGLKIDGFSKGYRIQSRAGGGGNQGPIGTFKPWQNLTADLQKATSGQMSAEKQPI